MKYKDMTYAEFVKKLRVYENDCPACENDTQDFCDNYCEYNSKRGDCLLGMIDHAADALERLMAEVDRKDKALQAWVNTWDCRKENAIRHICDHCDTPIDVRLKEGACEDCPIITLVKEIFDEQPS